jgi:hypothetical protein
VVAELRAVRLAASTKPRDCDCCSDLSVDSSARTATVLERVSPDGRSLSINTVTP